MIGSNTVGGGPGTYSGPLPSLPRVNLQEGCVSDQTDVLQGTLDLLIMRIIAPEPMHGWAIAQRIQQMPLQGT